MAMFWASVDLLGDCWEWHGERTARGYGVFYIGGQRRSAHRLSYEWAHGRIPYGIMVCHRCDNPPCVRPEHFFLGTQLDNMRDAKAKGRTASGDRHYSHLEPHRVLRGERKGTAKLTDAQVEELRRLYQPDVRGSQIQLARQFGVSPAQVCRILKGRQRRSLDEKDEPIVGGPAVKLTDAQVAELRASYVPGQRGSKAELARRYGISNNYVARLLNGEYRQPSQRQ